MCGLLAASEAYSSAHTCMKFFIIASFEALHARARTHEYYEVYLAAPGGIVPLSCVPVSALNGGPMWP